MILLRKRYSVRRGNCLFALKYSNLVEFNFLKDSIVGYFWVFFWKFYPTFRIFWDFCPSLYGDFCDTITNCALFDLIYWKILDFWQSLLGDFDTLADLGFDFDFFKGSIVLYFLVFFENLNQNVGFSEIFAPIWPTIMDFLRFLPIILGWFLRQITNFALFWHSV